MSECRRQFRAKNDRVLRVELLTVIADELRVRQLMSRRAIRKATGVSVGTDEYMALRDGYSIESAFGWARALAIAEGLGIEVSLSVRRPTTTRSTDTRSAA